MQQADDARRALQKLPPRQSRRLKGFNLMILFADNGRAKKTTAWLHEIHGDEAKGLDKEKARELLGYGGDPSEDSQEEGDPGDPDMQVAARFIGREHLNVNVIIDEPARRGMPLTYLEGLSDVEFTATSQMAKDRKVATRWEVNGRHTAPLFGVPATGRQVMVSGLTVVTFDEQPHPEGHGRVTRALEEWTYWDLPSLAEQIGATP